MTVDKPNTTNKYTSEHQMPKYQETTHIIIRITLTNDKITLKKVKENSY